MGAGALFCICAIGHGLFCQDVLEPVSSLGALGQNVMLRILTSCDQKNLMKDLFNLFIIKDKVAIITGASQGVGRITALAFAALGAKVTVASRHIETFQTLIAQHPKFKKNLFPIKVDITDQKQIQHMVDQTVKRFGHIDILINNAGVFIPGNPDEMTEEEWDLTLNTNLKGAFFCAQAAGRVMRSRGHGKIINISSVSGSRATPIPLSASYDASKGGLENLTRALAVAWARYRINVNAIAPCALETGMKIPLPEAEERKKIEWIPMGRRGMPEDLIGAIVFLSSPASDFITGHILAVDGGRLAW
jgi:NAD(P)-dependent dehydrogenase (short-subunit alcohol dehydrogenase family)